MTSSLPGIKDRFLMTVPTHITRRANQSCPSVVVLKEASSGPQDSSSRSSYGRLNPPLSLLELLLSRLSNFSLPSCLSGNVSSTFFSVLSLDISLFGSFLTATFGSTCTSVSFINVDSFVSLLEILLSLFSSTGSFFNFLNISSNLLFFGIINPIPDYFVS